MNSMVETRYDGTGVGSSTKVGRGGNDSVNERIRCVPPIKIISEFIVACENGDVPMVKFWWDKNPSILRVVLNNRCYDDDLFYVICERGYLQLAKWVISTNPNFASDLMHEDLMTDICLSGKVSMAKWLLKLCPHFLQLVIQEADNLFLAVCKMGYLNMAKWLGKINPEIIKNKRNLIYPFWKSCAKGKLNVAKWLYSISSEEVYSLEKDTVAYEKKQVIFANVCRKGHIAVVKWLLTIMPTISDEDDIRTIFHQTCMAGHLNIAKCIFSAYPDTNISAYDDHTFRMVCSWGRLNVAMWLLKIKPDIDITAEDAHAFHEACTNGHLHVAKWLLQLHIQSEIVNNTIDGYTFTETCLQGHLEVAKLLFDINPGLEFSIDEVINIRKANTDVVKWLFEVMPYLYSFQSRCQLSTAFEISCLTGNIELVQMLFEKQPEYISDRTTITSIAFAAACCSGNMELVNWLLTNFSNINISDDDELPFINACTNGHFMLAKRLLEINPVINVSANGDKAFKKACENGHVDVIRWLENMFPEKYSVGQPIYLGNGLELEYDDSSDEEEEEEAEAEYLDSQGDVVSNYTYAYTISKFIEITQNILAKDIPKEIDDCSICLDSRSNVYTSCSHMYCKPCISKWLKTHDTCPCCRVELLNENMTNIDF